MRRMFRQFIARLRRRTSAPPASSQIEIRTGEVLELRLSRPLPESFRSLAAGEAVECLTPFIDGNTVTSIRRVRDSG